MGEPATSVQLRDEQPIDEIRNRGVPAEGVLLRRVERFLIEVKGDVSAGPA
jgi:hypothetical protein